MAIFGKKKTEEKDESKEAEKKETKLGLPQGKDPRLYKLIEKPVVTEKAFDLSGGNKYVFRVWRKTNKIEVKKAVEKLYDVKVRDVRIINLPSKKRQLGRFEGLKPGFKKAVVTLKEGYKIEVTP